MGRVGGFRNTVEGKRAELPQEQTTLTTCCFLNRIRKTRNIHQPAQPEFIK